MSLTVIIMQKCKIIIIDTIQAPCTTSDPSSYGSQLRSLKDVTDSDPYTPIAAPPFIPKNFGACAKMSLALGVHMMGGKRPLIIFHDYSRGIDAVIESLVFNALERSFVSSIFTYICSSVCLPFFRANGTTC